MSEFLPIPPTNAIADPQTRAVLEALAHNIRVSPSVYLAQSDASAVASQAIVDVLGGGLPGSTTSSGAVINQLATAISQSALFAALGERINIDLNTVTRASDEANAELNSLVQGLSTGITSINSVASTSASAAARALYAVNAAVTDPTTGLAAAQASIIAINTVTAGSTSASAQALFSVTSTVDQKNKVFFQTTAPTSTSTYTLKTNDLWIDSNDGNKAYRYSGTAWVETTDTRVASAVSGVSSEASTRATKDDALAAAVNNIWAKVGGSTAAISDSSLASVTPSTAVATKWDSVVSAVTDPNTGQVNSASIVQEFDTYANNADSTFNALYTVRAQVESGGSTQTATVIAGDPGVAQLTLSAANPSIVAGMRVVGPGVRPGTTVTATLGATIGLSTGLLLGAPASSASFTATADTPPVYAPLEFNGKFSTTLRLTAPNANIVPGMKLTGTGIPTGTTVVGYSSNSPTRADVMLSAPLNANASGTYTFLRTYEFTTAKLLLGGFGLAATSGAGSSGTPTIDFGVRADRFYIAAASDTPSLTDQLASSDTTIPFIVTTTLQSIGGVTYPPGVYIKKAIIADATIDTAKITNASITSLKIGDDQVTIPRTFSHSSPAAGTSSIDYDMSYTLTSPGRVLVFVSLVLQNDFGTGVATNIQLLVAAPSGAGYSNAYAVSQSAGRPVSFHWSSLALAAQTMTFRLTLSSIGGAWAAGGLPNSIQVAVLGAMK